jgi:transposase
MRNKRRYDKEFKEHAVEMVTVSGRRVCDVARDLGITEKILSRWKSEFLAGLSEAFPGTGHRSASDEELHKLKRELSISNEEREILKKALAIFSKEPG